MKRTIGTVLFAALLAAPRLYAQGEPESQPTEPAKEEGTKEEKPKEDPGDPEALKALQAGSEFSMKKKFTFKGSLDVEVAGSSMFAIEMKGEHAGKWTHVATEAMGRAMEAYTDGETTLTLDSETGEWRVQGAGGQGGGRGGRGGRGGMRGGLNMDQIVKVVKSAKFDGEAKVGSHVCRVVRGQADADALRKIMGGGRMGGGGEVKKSSLKFYVDKEDGRLRRIKLTMDAETNMGGQGPMDLHITSDYRYTYSKNVKVELPEGAKAALEAKPEAPKEGEGEKPADPKPAEGSGEGK